MNPNTYRQRKSARHTGFTLIELLVVLAILALLGGLVGPKIMGALGGAKTKTAAVQAKNLENALKTFHIDVGRYPTNAEGLGALVAPPGGVTGWNGPYLEKNVVPKDPWGRDFYYRVPGQHGDVDIYSLGADGQPGGDGENADVGNW